MLFVSSLLGVKNGQRQSTFSDLNVHGVEEEDEATVDPSDVSHDSEIGRE